LAVERPWLLLGGPFLFTFVRKELLKWLSGIGGLEYWTGILDWNTGMA